MYSMFTFNILICVYINLKIHAYTYINDQEKGRNNTVNVLVVTKKNLFRIARMKES